MSDDRTMAKFTVAWVVVFLVSLSALAQELAVSFSDVTQSADVAVEHGYVENVFDLYTQVSGGAAGGDIDADGWPDLYVVGGDLFRQYLFLNNRDGSFRETALDAGVDFAGEPLSGPALGDIDGDGDLDLFIGGIPRQAGVPPARLLRNDGRGVFEPVSHGDAPFPVGAFSGATFGDFNRDGWLDILTPRWGMPLALGSAEHLWRNAGGGRFVPGAEEAGLNVAIEPTEFLGDFVWSFTANFADLNDDGWPDLLLASDFGYSQAFLNRGSAGFEEIGVGVFTDENGMGAAVGDFDNDGRIDWFVTSIYVPEGTISEGVGPTGNRLYRNLGSGEFEDVTEEAGVRDGAWGWGACAADFDNDGWLDIFHVNGWMSALSNRWMGLPARLYMNAGDGTFLEKATQAGIDDRGEGRGVVCFDYDRDGDIDVFISNITGPVRLYRNELNGRGNFLQVKLVGRPPNTEAIGARLAIVADGLRQIREIQGGGNYLSQNPAVAHFGLDRAPTVATLEVRWPRGGITELRDIPSNQHLVIYEVDGDASCDGQANASDLPAVIAAIARGPTAQPCPGGDLNYDGSVDGGDVNRVLRGLFAP